MEYSYSNRRTEPEYVMYSPAPNLQPIHEEKKGCCFFTNQFYLMTSFGGTLSCVVIFQVLALLLLGFLWPACWCSTFWAHLSLLDTNMKLMYSAALIFILMFGVFGSIAMTGIYNEQRRKVYPFLVMMIVVEIGLFCAAILVFYKFGQIRDSIMNDPAMIAQMGQMVLKPEMYDAMAAMTAPMMLMFNGQEPDLKAAMEASLKPEMVTLMDAGERLMKFVTVAALIGLNLLFIATIVCSIKLIGRMAEYERLTAVTDERPLNMNYGSTYKPGNKQNANYASSITSSRSKNRNRDEELIVPMPEKRPLPETEYINE